MINDAARKTSLTIFTSPFIARVRKGCSRFACERELETEHNCNILTPHSYGRHVVSFLFFGAAQPEAKGLTLLDAGFLYCILSASSLDPKFHRSFRGPPRSGVVFPTTPPLQLSRTLLVTALARQTQLNYIIVRRPLDLWNRMFNRHQAEITVMQFTGHSLPVHHSVVYHGNFYCSSHFISQFPPTRFPLITAIRMCHLLRVHHLEWHFWPGQKVKTQQSSINYFSKFNTLNFHHIRLHHPQTYFTE